MASSRAFRKVHSPVPNAGRNSDRKQGVSGIEDAATRRVFLKSGALLLAASMMSGRNTALAQSATGGAWVRADGTLVGKHPDLVVLNDRPVNAETPAHLLNDLDTPGDVHFVRNNGIPPAAPRERGWTLTVAGESVVGSKTYTLQELKTRFRHHTYRLVLECGGNGRAEFNPSARGNQWTTGAVACAAWTGIRLKDVLEDVGIKNDAVYIGYYGADTHLSGDRSLVPISRGVPMSKAMEDETLIAWAINGEKMPVLNGYPLRLVIGGWPASVSGKWLDRIVVRNKVHDGEKMGGMSYRVPRNPVAPGTSVAEEDMEIIQSMPVRSLITAPKTGGILTAGRRLEVEGKAWAGDLSVAAMHTSFDFGATWQEAELDAPPNRLAWQAWRCAIQLPDRGYYEIWARATDSNGRMQPMIVPGWNPRGYLNNACHRVAVKVA
ncbi:MAG: sulfite oxidase [Opitutaceae bacterium]